MYSLRVVGILACLVCVAALELNAQTCCSGGVPLSGNIGFDGADRGTFQLELSYDLNVLATLKNGAEVYDDEARERITQSVLMKTGYSLTSWMALDAIISYVWQSRTISYQGAVTNDRTNGPGDAVVMAKFVVSRLGENGTEIQLGAGPKIPVGRSDLPDGRGITLNADLQPGSGSWDLITWGYFLRQLKAKPTAVFSLRLVGRVNGTNQKYLGNELYKFGNSFQAYAGIGDQFLLIGRVFSASLSFSYRLSFANRINGILLDNTGGRWMNIIPSFGWNIGPNSLIQLVPEIPVISRVEGIQLTPTFRIQAGIYHRFGGRKINQIKTFQL